MKTPTPQEFVENWPLYTKAAIRGFEPPKSITRACKRCKKETTWTLAKAAEARYRTGVRGQGSRLLLQSLPRRPRHASCSLSTTRMETGPVLAVLFALQRSKNWPTTAAIDWDPRRPSGPLGRNGRILQESIDVPISKLWYCRSCVHAKNC